MSKRLILFILLVIGYEPIFSQYDSEFWFVVPDASDKHASGFPSRFVFTNSSNFTAFVTIEMPQNSAFTTKEIKVPALSTRYYYFQNINDQHIIENEYNKDYYFNKYGINLAGANNKGIHIRSRTVSNLVSPDNDTKCDIFVYYELLTGGDGSTKNTFPDGQINEVNTGAQNNPELYSLYGKNALGTDFYTVFQWDVENKDYDNPHECTSSIDVVVTEDNTNLTITIPKGKFVYDEYAPGKRRGSATTAVTFTVGPFKKGETYRMSPARYYPVTVSAYVGTERFGRSKYDRLRGVRIQATKKVAVSLSDDSMYSPNPTSYNVGGDQLIPVDMAGKVYFAQKGALDDDQNMENVYLTAIKPNTNIYVNGVWKGKMVNAGDSLKVKVDSIVYISSPDNPFIALQVTGSGRELGMAILPTIETCTGSTRVGFSRGVDGPINLLILCRTGSEDFFKITTKSYTNEDSLIYPVTAAEKLAFSKAFKPISATNNDWRYQKLVFTNTSVIKVNGSYTITNENDVFHLGIVNGGTAGSPKSGGTRYGYFSNYNVVQATALINESGNNQHFVCYGDKVQIVAKGGVFYKWTPENYLSNALIESPVAYPPVTTTYKAIVRGYCNTTQSVQVSVVVLPKLEASFELDTVSGCDPLILKIKNKSTGPSNYRLDFGDGSSKFERTFFDPLNPLDEINIPTIDTTFIHTYLAKTAPDSNVYNIKLIARNSSFCSDTMTRSITVFPKVTINSMFPDTSGCDSLKVMFRQNTNNAQFFNWEYGDQHSSATGSSVHSHIYRNLTSVPITYTAKLTARTKYHCSASMTRNITVQPFLHADFAIDSTYGCGDKPINIFNLSKGGFTSYNLDFGDGTLTSGGGSIPKIISKTYPNNTNNVLTHKVLLKVSNFGGTCSDTISTHIRVYPKVDVSIDPNTPTLYGCGPFEVNLKSKLNFPLSPIIDPIKYKWEFGDSSSSTLTDVSHTYVNQGTTMKSFPAKLVASSSYCSDTAKITINVYGRLKADFTNDASTGCGSLKVNFQDNSLGEINERYWMLSGNTFVRDDNTSISRTYTNDDPASPVTQYQNIQLMVKNSVTGCSDISKINRLTIHPKVTAGFNANYVNNCNPVQVNLENTTKLPAKHFMWNFSDGASSGTNSINTDHTFENLTNSEQNYRVQLVAYSDSGCYDTLNTSLVVYPKILSGFVMNKATLCSNTNTKERTLITNNSLGGMNKYEWDYDGNGVVDQTFNSIVFPPINQAYPDNLGFTDAIYYPKLTVSYKGCTDEFIDTVRVYPKVEAGFVSDKYKGCNPLKFTLTNTSKRTNKYTWNFSDGSSSNTLNTSLNHEFSNIDPSTGNYWVNLVASSDYCRDTIKIDTFKVYSFIKADFSINKQEMCSGETVQIINNSPAGAIHNKWSFGDNSIIADMNRDPLSHKYLNTDVVTLYRNLTLKVKNDQECYDSLTRSMTIFPAVDVKIDVDTFAGCTPFVAQFGNKTNVVANKFFWTFGDGSSSNEKNVFHKYNNILGADKDYWAVLEAESPNTCTDKDSVKITAYAYVKADFKLKNAELCPGSPLKISNASVGEVNNNLWDFNGDGSLVSNASQELDYFYSNYGETRKTINLKLKVENNHLCADSITRPVIIFPKVTADFSPDTAGCTPLPVNFVNKTKLPGTSFSWDFADGNTSKLRDPAHTFVNKDAFGKDFVIKLRAFSDDRCFHDTSHVVRVHSYIKADFKIEKAEICSDDSVIITDNTPPGVTIRKWDFDGDGIFLPSDTMRGRFAKAYFNSDPKANLNIHMLTMAVSNGQCADTIKTPVTVFPKVVASFTAEPAKICNGEKVSFTNKTEGAIKSLNWEFGNGSTSNLPNNTIQYKHTSPMDSIFKVKLTAISPYLCKSDSIYDILVHSYIVADFKVPEAAVCSHVPINIYDVSLGSTGITKRTWDFESDGTVDEINNASPFNHVFKNYNSETAVNKISLTIFNKDLCSSSISRDIKVYPKVTASYERDSAGCHPFTVSFNSDKTKNATDFNWYFGDGGTSGFKNPSKIFHNYFSKDTFYNVKFVAISDYYCSDSITKKVHVYHKPGAKFELDRIEGCAPFSTIITNKTETSNATYDWKFDDGKDSTTTNFNPFTHTFEIERNRIVPKPYQISLKAITNHQCTDSVSAMIRVFPKVSISIDSVMPACNPSVTQFSVKALNVQDYYWDFGDGVTSNIAMPAHEFLNPSGENKVFPVNLLATSDRGCTGTTKTHVLILASPVVSFFIEPWQKRFPDAGFLMIDSTNKGPWKYTWDFGNGFVKELPQTDSFTYNYPHWGKFDVKLLVENFDYPECRDSLIQPIVLIAPRPIAQFDSSMSACTPVTIRFKNNSIYGEKFSWDFDDGTLSDKIEPEHTFSEPGEYFVKLYVEAEGGKDSYFQRIKVYPKPTVDFTVEPQLIMLPDDKARGFNATGNAVRYLWDFGDGTTYDSLSPIHYYKELGNYTIKLKAWTEYGCTDSLERPGYVEVLGKGKLVFPNAFTPSTFGARGGQYNSMSVDNDIFYPYHEGVAEYRLEIYNRWGELIFTSEDVNVGWDGYYKNKLVKQDVYVYKVKAKFYNGKTIVKAGDVTLLHKNF